jgi:hypothetical protein
VGTTVATKTTTTTTLWMNKSRKARRQDREEKQSRGRSQQFYEAIEEAKRKKEMTENNNGMGGGDGDRNDKTSTSALLKDQPASASASVAVAVPESSSSSSSSNKGKGSSGSSSSTNVVDDGDDDGGGRAARAQEAQQRMEARPDVSSVILDDETGMDVIVPGRNVMDVVTRKAVKMSDMGPQFRLAQMFPGVPDEIRSKYRFKNWKSVSVPDMVQQLQSACEVKLDGSTDRRGIPPHPSVSNKAIDFVVANRDLLGPKMSKTLGRLAMNAAWKGDNDRAVQMRKLWKHFLTLENHVSAPFRQIIHDAEGRMGPNFGNLDLMSFANGELYERIGNYILLKGMVAHWEKKVVDADYIEKNPPMSGEDEDFLEVLVRGDPRRYLADSPIFYTLKECSQVCAMAQQMCNQFVATEELFRDFPPEIVFLEDALKVRGGTALRKYMIEEFCPSRGITPEGLREGMRRFYQQLDNLQIDPYADITNKVQDLCYAMAVGTDDAFDPYLEYLGFATLNKDNPAYYETYTFNASPNSVVSFMDNQYESAGNNIETFIGPTPSVDDATASKSRTFNNPLDGFFKAGGDNPIESLFGDLGMGDKDLRSEPPAETEDPVTRVPKERSIGRSHEAGWLDVLDGPEGEVLRMGEVPTGRIIPDE